MIRRPRIRIYNQDCMVAMSKMKDKEYDLAIVDPPFFVGPANKDYFNSRIKNTRVENLGNIPFWKAGIPTKEYYKELVRVSKHQIIWGCNYYEFLQPCGRIVWDKINDNTPFSDCELASIDLIKSVRIFRYKWNGMIQQDMKNKEFRIHPTQKPVALYQWLLKNYAKQGDRILDTHGGSCSSAIACDIMGFDCDVFEIDKDYYEAAVARYERHKKVRETGFLFDTPLGDVLKGFDI